jgi:hypothetical protein
MSTETAPFQVIQRLQMSLNHKEIALGSLMAIEGAFDNTSFDAITSASSERGIEGTCCKWISSVLESRLVHPSLTGSNLTSKFLVGCPQGGVLSPLLWNLVVDRLLIVTNDLGFCTCGYANNIVVKVHGKFAHTLREFMQEALSAVVKCAANKCLNISPHKIAIVPLANRWKVEGLGPLQLHGKELGMLDEVKYL